MYINKLFSNKKLLDNNYDFFIKKRLTVKIGENEDLVEAHLEKAKHNMLFFKKNLKDSQFNDWLIVTLYYALYHAVLALIVKKRYTSKNHTASLVFLIKHYSQLKEDILLVQELSIKKEDAELYTKLKEDRHKASYESKINFTNKNINDYKQKVKNFIQKTEELIQ
ncbi:MAG: HEPN domain-containing protein [Nanoarchaeota archaeon]|nr:HEPN domain-containing protein [Nanoarchaeota archaeon]MBU4242390.1 HEPN domain-containing protein [Nanoarchaeota archaeon]MBU4351627.1 HEPN domain-containing protein [Nanoarchaeota archaeon]